MGSEKITPLLVLRNHFGELPSSKTIEALSTNQMRDLGELVIESAAASVDEPVASDVYYGGGWLGAGWHESLFRSDILHSLLYYPRLLVHDPLANFFFNGLAQLPRYRAYRSPGPDPIEVEPLRSDLTPIFDHFKDDPRGAARALSAIIVKMNDLAPLIDSGVLILRTQWPIIAQRLQPIEASVRHNLKNRDMLEAAEVASQYDPPPTVWDNMRGMKTAPHNGIRAGDKHLFYQQDFFYLAKTLAIADHFSVRYVPQIDADYKLLSAYACSLPKRLKGIESPPGRMLSEVARFAVPSLNLDQEKMLSLRRDEDAFEDWRLSLRRLARDGKDDDDETLSQRVEEELTPRIHAIRRNLKRSNVFRQSVPEGMSVAISATIGGAGSLSAAPGALAWLYRVLKKPSPGNDTVLARLIQH